MRPPIDGSGMTVGQLLSAGPQLVVPYFQRGYAWQRENVERLLADVSHHADGNGEDNWYPLGAIILAKTSQHDHLIIADGQQRLVTLTILLAVLRDLSNDADLTHRLDRCVNAPSGVPCLQPHEPLREQLMAYVQRSGATRTTPPEPHWELSPSIESILDNRDWVAQKLASLAEPDRNRLAEFLLDRTYLAVMTVESEAVARLLFATMHETGIRPQTTDLIKSQILGRLSGEARDHAQSVWERYESHLGHQRLEGLLLGLASIKSRHTIRDRVDLALSSAFDLSTTETTEEFVFEHFKPMGKILIDIVSAQHGPNQEPGPLMRRMQYLGWVVRHDTWQLPALHWLSRHPYDSPRTLTFFKRLEALAWIQMIRGEDVQRRDRRYLSLLEDIDQDRALEPANALEVTPSEIDQAIQVLTGPTFFKRTYKLFLLLRLNAIYEGESHVQLAPEATVEHIYPQRPDRKSRWQEDFRSAQGSAQASHELGNLTLLTEQEQNLARNAEFSEKRQVYAESTFAMSRKLTAYDTWRPADISARTQQMVSDLLVSFGLK